MTILKVHDLKNSSLNKKENLKKLQNRLLTQPTDNLWPNEQAVWIIWAKLWLFILTYFPVIIWASIGIIVANKDDTSVPDSTNNLVYAILGLTCVFFVLRIVIVVLRQLKRPLGKSGISQISDKPIYWPTNKNSTLLPDFSTPVLPIKNNWDFTKKK